MDVTSRIRILAEPQNRTTRGDNEPYLSVKCSQYGFIQCFITDLFDRVNEAWSNKWEIECVLSVDDKVGRQGTPYVRLLDIVQAIPTDSGQPEVPPEAGGHAEPEPESVVDEGGGGNFGAAIDEEDQ